MARKIVIALIVLTALAGCGRKGSLEAPGAIAAPQPATAGASNDPGAAASPAKPKAPDTPFFLDALI